MSIGKPRTELYLMIGQGRMDKNDITSERIGIRLRRLISHFNKIRLEQNIDPLLDLIYSEGQDLFPKAQTAIYLLDLNQMMVRRWREEIQYVEQSADEELAQVLSIQAALSKEIRDFNRETNQQLINNIVRKPKDIELIPTHAVAVPLYPADNPDLVQAVFYVKYKNKVDITSELEVLTCYRDTVNEILSEISINNEKDSSRQFIDAILKFSSYFTTTLDLNMIIRQLVFMVNSLLEADRASVWVIDEDAQEIYTIFALGTNGFRMKKHMGLAGSAITTGNTLNIRDAHRHPLFNPAMDLKTGYRTKSVLVMPMVNKQGEIIGAFQAINKLTKDVFTASDEAVLRAISAPAAMMIENAILYQEQKKRFDSVIQVMASSVDGKDPTTGDHTKMVTGIAVTLARELGFSERWVEKIRVAAILHDYGKIAIPDVILTKPSLLNQDELKVMFSHVEQTIHLLEQMYFSRDMRDIPLIAGGHHEKMDGSGYPNQISDAGLILPIRILCVADVAHALMQERPYKQGQPCGLVEKTLLEMTSEYIDNRNGKRSGKHLDLVCVQAFINILKRYPRPEEALHSYRENWINSTEPPKPDWVWKLNRSDNSWSKVPLEIYLEYYKYNDQSIQEYFIQASGWNVTRL